MDTTEPFPDVEDFRAEFQRRLTRFVDTEIQLGYTFAALATTERVLGNSQHFLVAKGDAAKAAAVIRKFLNRIDDTELRRKAEDRCIELERSIHSLNLQAKDRGAQNALG